MRQILFTTAIIILLFAGCSKDDDDKNKDDDTITRILSVADFGTCGWGLMAFEGPPHPWTGSPTHSHTFFAENLPNEYKTTDYFRVRVTYRYTDKDVSCFGSYPIINIVSIQKL